MEACWNHHPAEEARLRAVQRAQTDPGHTASAAERRGKAPAPPTRVQALLGLQHQAGNAAVSRALTAQRHTVDPHGTAAVVQRAPDEGTQPAAQEPQQPAAEPSLLAAIVPEFMRRINAFNQTKAVHDTAVSHRDYEQGKRPRATLQRALEVAQILKYIEQKRVIDPQVEQWCVLKETQLLNATKTIDAAIAQYGEQWRNYGYFLMLHFGQLWEQPELAAQRPLVENSYSGYFQSLSREARSTQEQDPDVARVRQGHALSSSTEPAWIDRKRDEIEAGLRRCVLRHYAPANRVEGIMGPAHAPAPDPVLKSAAILEDEKPGFENNTTSYDTGQLANHGFVFFYIEQAGAGFRGSRFGGDDPARITLPISMLEQRRGWVMQNDFLDREFPTIRADDEGKTISYVREADEDLTFEIDELGGYDEYSSVPAKSPEGRLKKAVHESRKLYLDADASIKKMAATAKEAGALARARKNPEKMVALMRQLQQEETDLRDQLAGIDRTKLAEQQEERTKALADSRKYSHKVRIHRPAADGKDAGESHYHGSAVREARPEPIKSNILFGADIVPGLAQRCVIEIARIERQRPEVAARLKAMAGDDLIRVLLKDFVRPQAMLQAEVSFTRANVEFKNPRGGRARAS